MNPSLFGSMASLGEQNGNKDINWVDEEEKAASAQKTEDSQSLESKTRARRNVDNQNLFESMTSSVEA